MYLLLNNFLKFFKFCDLIVFKFSSGIKLAIILKSFVNKFTLIFLFGGISHGARISHISSPIWFPSIISFPPPFNFFLPFLSSGYLNFSPS